MERARLTDAYLDRSISDNEIIRLTFTREDNTKIWHIVKVPEMFKLFGFDYDPRQLIGAFYEIEVSESREFRGKRYPEITNFNKVKFGVL